MAALFPGRFFIPIIATVHFFSVPSVVYLCPNFNMSTFDELGLNENLLKSVHDLGFTQPTPIQEKSIPVLLSGTKDLIGLAQTGTGKTAAFGLPLLQLIQTSKKFPQALIVCPTRELCLQIVNEIELFKKYLPAPGF